MDVFLHSIGSSVPLSQTKKSPTGDGPGTNHPGSSVVSDDTIEASLQLRTLTETAMSAPIVSQERVNRVASAIASGHYAIDPQKAANRLVEFELLAL